MQRLPIHLLEPGMVVARDVVNDKAMVLVAEDTELTGKLIFRLENMKIRNVLVQGCPVQLADYLPKTLGEKLADMKIGFSHAGDDLTMKKFRVLLKAHFIKSDNEMKARETKTTVPETSDSESSPGEPDSEPAHD